MVNRTVISASCIRYRPGSALLRLLVLIALAT